MNILIGGASGAIAQALILELSQQGHHIYSISRSALATHLQDHIQQHLQLNLSDNSCMPALKEFVLLAQPDVVFSCAGVLHTAAQMPEKSLAQLNADWLHQSVDANILPHIHLAQAVAPVVTRSHPIKWISLSAMVGSLTDNSLGGWYSYRMCKAALNMFIKNLSIEWGRKSPDTLVVAQHPGTTDSNLSKPFQAHVVADHLFSPELTASRLCAVMYALNASQQGKLLHWDGSVLPY